ncbi:hypothetical protein CRE_20390 [Caenorhabditis remanei]|uniref:Uncharacterized protein n=1 Tax=Caenorhabditis remanei TaxID=31234 RepID=E3MD35_CAERE|nr:hypothetical protein CRE_20390 [Caenorhabditis remanei]
MKFPVRCSTSTTYSPTSTYGYSNQYYNPSSTSTSTVYRNPSTSYGNPQQQQGNQNFVAYDTTNQNSPYYYQRVPSTAQYNSVLGVNAGFPQNSNQVLRDQSNQGMYNTQTTQGYGNQGYQNQMMYNNPQNTQTSTFMYASSTQQQPQQYNNNQQQQYGNNQQQQYNTNQQMGSTGYNNQLMYNPSSQQQYGSSTPSPQYSADSISCCSQVSSTCCYQTQQGGYSAQQPSNNAQYSPSVYQYGRK